MKKASLFSSLFIISITLFIFCALPPDPAENPDNADIHLFTENKNPSVTRGSSLKVGIEVKLSQHITSTRVTSSCQNIDTLIDWVNTNEKDTIFIYPEFSKAGLCELYVTATVNDMVKKSDTLGIYVIIKDSVPVNVGGDVESLTTLITVDAPKTLFTETIDTLIFTVDNGIQTGKLDLKLVISQDNTLDSGFLTIVPSGNDSLLIKVTPTAPLNTDSVKIGVEITNGTISDTLWYPITFVDKETALLNKTGATLTAVEGKKIEYNMKPFLQVTEGVTFNTDIGIITDNFVWEWIPLFGSKQEVVAIITAKKDKQTLDFTLTLTVTPGDSTAPKLALVDTTLDGRRIGSPQISVVCTAQDSESGVDSVTFTCDSKTIVATLQGESRYSGVIEGLKSGVPAQITISAIDKSMNRNHSQLTFTVIYDSTVLDKEAPAFVYASGPKSGNRVKESEGTIRYTITDKSGVDSVWWELNGTAKGAIVKGNDEKYTLSYYLTVYGNNTITIFARDGSRNRNPGNTEVKLFFNTEPAPVTIASPIDNASGVAVEPQFSWIGGTDTDGDIVYYKVFYGSSETSLTTSLAEIKERSISILSSNRLAANSMYYWKVVGYTKEPYADTVVSKVVSFTTIGSAPVITTNLKASHKINEGEALVLSVVATGAPAPTYQWYKDNVRLTGNNDAEFRKNNSVGADAGVYHVVVSNGVGENISSAKTTVSIAPKVVISTDPKTVTAVEGGNVSFIVEATGAPTLTYQWLKDGSPINGATSATYKINTVTPADGGIQYSCKVSNGFSEATSATALLTVNPAPLFTVTYNRNTGTGNLPSDSKQYKSGEQVVVLDNPATNGISKSNFSFVGWNTRSDGTGSQYSPGAKFTIASENVVLYAQWEAVVYKITYYLEDGTNGNNPATYTSTPSAISLENASKIAYVFDGWYSSPSKVATSRVTSIPGGSSGDKEFWAKWVIKDVDGNIYTEVTIGNQVWMVENLKTTKFKNGAAIPLVPDSAAWLNLTTPGYCWYGNHPAWKDPFGALYNWYAVNGDLAPEGWHVPTATEYQALTNYLIANRFNWDGTTTGYKYAKALAATTWWKTSETQGEIGYDLSVNNRTGFTALPGGIRNGGVEDFSALTEFGSWWLSGEWSTTNGCYFGTYYYYSGFDSYCGMEKRAGLSVRCIRDY